MQTIELKYRKVRYVPIKYLEFVLKTNYDKATKLSNQHRLTLFGSQAANANI